MKAGDLAYESASLPGSRGELVEWLCDAIEAALGPDDTDRLSNGPVADALLRCLDLAVQTETQMAALQAFLDDTNLDDGSDA
jgi:hypothetical protein